MIYHTPFFIFHILIHCYGCELTGINLEIANNVTKDYNSKEIYILTMIKESYNDYEENT